MRKSLVLVFAIACVGIGCARTVPPLEEHQTAEHWIEVLKSNMPATRVKAVKKLSSISNRDTEAMPAIFEALADKDAAVRREAVYAVARNGTISQDGWPLLQEMMERDTDPDVRKIAAEAYGNLTESK